MLIAAAAMAVQGTVAAARPPMPLATDVPDEAKVVLPKLDVVTTEADAADFDKYFYFHRADTAFPVALADLRECDGYARGLSSPYGYVDTPAAYNYGLAGAAGGLRARLHAPPTGTHTAMPLLHLRPPSRRGARLLVALHLAALLTAAAAQDNPPREPRPTPPWIPARMVVPEARLPIQLRHVDVHTEIVGLALLSPYVESRFTPVGSLMTSIVNSGLTARPAIGRGGHGSPTRISPRLRSSECELSLSCGRFGLFDPSIAAKTGSRAPVTRQRSRSAATDRLIALAGW